MTFYSNITQRCVSTRQSFLGNLPHKNIVFSAFELGKRKPLDSSIITLNRAHQQTDTKFNLPSQQNSDTILKGQKTKYLHITLQI